MARQKLSLEEKITKKKESAKRWRDKNQEKLKEYRDSHKDYFTAWRSVNKERIKADNKIRSLVKKGISKAQAKAKVVIPKTKKITSDLIEKVKIRKEKSEAKEKKERKITKAKARVISKKTQSGEIIKLSEFIKPEYEHRTDLEGWWNTALDTDLVLENKMSKLSAKDKKQTKQKIEEMRKYSQEMVQDDRSKDKNYRPSQLGKKETSPDLKYIFRQYKLKIKHYAGLVKFLEDYRIQHGNFYTQIELNPIGLPDSWVEQVGQYSYGTTTFLYSGRLALNKEIARILNTFITSYYNYEGSEVTEIMNDSKILSESASEFFTGSIIVTMKYAEGGCSRKNEVEKRIDTEEGTFLVWSPKSQRNNCGIELLSRIAGHKIIADKEKRELGIEVGSEVTPEQLVKIGHKHEVHRIKIIDSQMNDLMGEGKYKLEEVEKMLTEGIEIILLRNNHYYMVISKAKEMTCKRCNGHYWKSHDCSSWKKTCDKCGSIYKEAHKCNPNRAGFHQAKKAKKENVKKAWKDIEEEEKNKLKYRLMTWDIETRNSKTEFQDMVDPKVEEGKVKWVTRYHRQVATLLSYTIQEHDGCVTKQSFLGTDCVKKFLEFLFQSANEGKYFNLIAHNGGKFDCYFILNEIALNPDWNKYLDQLKGLKMKGPKIMQISWRNHNFIDSCCFLAGSLDFLTNAFACEKKKLVSGFKFGNKEMTNEELLEFRKDLSPDEFLTWIQGEESFTTEKGVVVEAKVYLEQYVKYCEMDCESLLELWQRFVLALMKLLDTKQSRDHHIRFQNSFCPKVQSDIRHRKGSIKYIKDIERFPTIQAFTKKVFYAYNETPVWEEKYKDMKNGMRLTYKTIKEYTGHIMEKLPEEAFNFIKKTAIGGISDVQNPGLHQGNLKLFDVVSLYPNNMIQPAPWIPFNGDGSENIEFQGFGCGEITWTGEEIFVEDKVGFYQIENIISPDNHSTTITDIPRYNVEKSGLDWRWKENPGTMVTSMDIRRMRKNGYTFKIVKGLHFAEKFNPFTEFVSVMINEKKNQDKLAKAKDPTYNQALREVCKLMANALFGKMLEAKVEKNAKYLDSLDAKFFDEHPLETLGVCWKAGKCLVKWEEQKKDAPIHLGAMILAYSRNQMMNFFDMVGRENIIATETDSMYVHTDKLKALQQSQHPIYKIGSELGNMKLEDEKGATNLNNCYFLGKKCYHVEFTSDVGEKIKTKMAWKGVPKKKLNKEKYVELFNNNEVKFSGITQFKPRMFVDYKKDYVNGQREAFSDVMISTNVRKKSVNTTERTYETYDMNGNKLGPADTGNAKSISEKNISA